MPRVFVMILILAAGASALADDPPARGDLAKLAGTWKTMSGPNKDIPLTFKIEENKITVTLSRPTRDDRTTTGELKLNDTATPKTIDFLNGISSDGDILEDSLAIYTLDGDELRMCIGAPGRQRPKEFKEGGDEGPQIFIFKREPAAAKCDRHDVEERLANEVAEPRKAGVYAAPPSSACSADLARVSRWIENVLKFVEFNM